MAQSSKSVKKTLVRNVEIPCSYNVLQRPVAINSLSKNRYTHPGPITVPKIKQQMERIRKADVPHSSNVNELTPNAVNFVQTMASQRLNFQSTATIYKGLQPINVNDSVLDLQCAQSSNYQHLRRFKSKFVRNHDKDPEPILTDYLRPIELMPQNQLLDDCGCDQIRLSQEPDSDVFFGVCDLLDRLDCEI